MVSCQGPYAVTFWAGNTFQGYQGGLHICQLQPHLGSKTILGIQPNVPGMCPRHVQYPRLFVITLIDLQPMTQTAQFLSESLSGRGETLLARSCFIIDVLTLGSSFPSIGSATPLMGAKATHGPTFCLLADLSAKSWLSRLGD